MDRKAQIKKWLKDILENNLQGIPYRAFIFGSQANQQVLKLADIDLGIITNSELPVSRLAQIDEHIKNLPMLFNVDVVDFNKADEVFKSVAMSNIEQL